MLYQRVGISSSSSRTLWRSGADTAYLSLGGVRPGGGAVAILGWATDGHKGVPTERNTCRPAVVDYGPTTTRSTPVSMQGWQALHSLTRDSSVKERRLAPGTTKRVMGYARPYKVQIAWFLGLVVIESLLVVATPLLLKSLIDDGIYPKDSAVVVRLSLLVAAIAVLRAP